MKVGTSVAAYHGEEEYFVESKAMAAALMHWNHELVLMGYRRTLWPLIAMRLTLQLLGRQ